MNIKHIRLAVGKIREAAGDYGAAHSLENALRQEFIEHVALHGPLDLSLMAREVLKSEDIDFPRYTA